METVFFFPLKSVLEFATGITVPRQAAQTFLDRIVNTDQSFADRDRKAPQDPRSPAALQKRNARVVANVLGLAVVMAVKYADGTNILSAVILQSNDPSLFFCYHILSVYSSS